MVPVILLAAGGLLGGVTTYLLSERERQTILDELAALERSHRDLENRIARAKQREEAQRLEKMQLVIMWCQARLKVISAEGTASLDRLRRIWGSAKAMERILRNLPSSAQLDARSSQFVELMVKIANGHRPTRSELATVEEYLADEIPDLLRDFLEDHLGRLVKRQQSELARLVDEQTTLNIEERALEDRERIAGSTPERAAALRAKRSRLMRIPKDVEKLEASLSDLKRALVVVVRLADENACEPSDEAAREILEQVVRGSELTDAEREYLDNYRDAHFAEAIQVLRSRRGIELLGTGSTAGA